MKPLIEIVDGTKATSEAEVETDAIEKLKVAGYVIKQRKCGVKLIDTHWPSKKTEGSKNAGFPDLLICIDGSDRPVCVWDNKAPNVSAAEGLADSKFYIEGLKKSLPHEPSLPRIAAGYNGKELMISYLTNENRWVSLKLHGAEIKDKFPAPDYIRNGISALGSFNAATGSATAVDLRSALPKLKTLYRVIPVLASGRVPVDFTIAVLTLRLLVELNPDWGTWAEQPTFSPGTPTRDQAIAERLTVLAKRVLTNNELRGRYGDIFEFNEKSDTLEIAFSFTNIVDKIEKGRGHFERLFEIVDALPPLTNADFDIFGEIYQSIGDEATKKALGEFFTGRHIISAVLPVLFVRAGYNQSYNRVKSLKIADIACGTGGFLTETLRLIKTMFSLDTKETRRFASSAFFGYDIGHANASRARVNMYFAGDGFSAIEGGFDSLSSFSLKRFPLDKFDLIATNPPYGKSSYGRSEEAFVTRVVESLKDGEGWGLLVLPTGILENPRSSKTRFSLLKHCQITDVIALPKHAFAPYTMQRTSVIIFNKRPSAVNCPEDDWEKLIQSIGNERIGMFIADNDGYANSDKRYPTDRKDENGRWYHNDLAPWIDSQGLKHEGKLYAALVNAQYSPGDTNEFGEDVGQKYGVFRVSELADPERGITLLPDTPLRVNSNSIPLQEFIARSTALFEFRKGKKVDLPQPFIRELEYLLEHPVDYSANHTFTAKISDLFDITKGDQGLTEAEIYKYHAADGLPVYGGGAAKPKFYISHNAKTNKNRQVTCFSGPSVVVAMDGSSGAMRIVDSGKFCSNHHARVLIPYEPSFELYWLVQQAELGLKSLASNKEGSATLTVSNLENYEVQVPDPATRRTINAIRSKLVKLRDEFE